MMKRHLRFGTMGLIPICCLVLLVGHLSAAPQYPAKPVTLIIPNPPGGDASNENNVLVGTVKNIIKQDVVMVNKGGGGGVIAAAEVAMAKPDGYTLLAAEAGPMVLGPLLEKVPYSMDSFEPICQTTMRFFVLAVQKDAKWKTLKDLISDAGQNPGKIRYACTSGGVADVSVQRLAAVAKVKFKKVPFAGGAESRAAILGGHVELANLPAPSTVPLMKAGKVRVLAIFAPERAPQLPETPTVKEQGYDVDDYQFSGWVAPKGTPKAILSFLEKSVEKAASDPGYQERMKKINAIPRFQSGDKFKALYERDYKKYKDLFDKVGYDK